MELDARKIRGLLIGAVIALGIARTAIPHLAKSTGERMLFDVVAILVGAGLIVFGFVVLRRKRLLENVPTSRVRSVAMGFAELLGVAKNRTPLVAPYSGIPCVYYRYLLEEERQRSRGGREWTTIDQGESTDPFYLQDETGALLVDPAGAETVLERSYRNIERGERWLGRRKRYSEWWIVTGQKLFVAGTVRRLRDAVLERRAALGDRLRTLKHDPEQMKRFDADHDGQISTEEWGNAVRSVQDELVREDAQAPAEPPEESIAIGKGSDETTFVIAERGGKSLLMRLRLEAAGSLAGGVVVVVVFAISFLSRAGVLQGGFVFPW
jgi:E3 ubiquitin ligase